jgi:hypothetical protein
MVNPTLINPNLSTVNHKVTDNSHNTVNRNKVMDKINTMVNQ